MKTTNDLYLEFTEKERQVAALSTEVSHLRVQWAKSARQDRIDAMTDAELAAENHILLKAHQAHADHYKERYGYDVPAFEPLKRREAKPEDMG